METQLTLSMTNLMWSILMLWSWGQAMMTRMDFCCLHVKSFLLGEKLWRPWRPSHRSWQKARKPLLTIRLREEKRREEKRREEKRREEKRREEKRREEKRTEEKWREEKRREEKRREEKRREEKRREEKRREEKRREEKRREEKRREEKRREENTVKGKNKKYRIKTI